MKKLIAVLAALAVLLLCPGFAVAEGGEPQMRPMVGIATDYALVGNWLQIPAITRPVDTFYLYPTTFIDPAGDAPGIAPIDDPAMRAGARRIFGRQAGVFADSTNVFAPFYRQSNLARLIGKDDEAFMEFQYQEQRTDVYAALDYYFEHLNGGRPFILAGHSQGSMMLKIALREYFREHADLLDRMVAAYVIGFSVTDEDLAANPALKFAQGADDVGVIVSWNTEGPENREQESAVVTPGAIAINPITWTRDDTYAPASENLGSRLPSGADGLLRDIVPGVADAQIDPERGVVICTTMPNHYISVAALDAPNPFGNASLHGVDYEAYYYSIRQNVATRIDAWLAKASAAQAGAEQPEERAALREADARIIEDFLDEFRLLAAIPRPTKHEKAVSDFLKQWAEDRGCSVRQNEVNDLIFDVPATPGYEALPLTALQAHMDMVCIGAEGRDYDPENDPIELIVDTEAGTLTADGTSLGADDGAGVAMIMSIVDGNMAHGPLRVILTVDEEIDMTGAMAITAEDLDGVKYLVNIDSEESDAVVVSTAADAVIVAEGTPRMAPASGDTALRLRLSGLKGGHSGVTIGEGKCNAIVAMGQTLAQLKARAPFELASFTGGRADNAIPESAEAVIVVDSADRAAVKDFVAEQEARLREAYRGVDDDIALSVGEADAAASVFEAEQEKAILDYVTRSMNGVNTMSADIEGLVESSSNMGIIAADAEAIAIRQMPRSSVGDRLAEIEAYQKRLGGECGLTVTIVPGSRPWPVKADSRIVPLIREIYRSLTGEEIRVQAIHAALECGAFSELSPALDMASIGPDLVDVHSPDETLYLASVAKNWRLLERLLVSLE